MATATTWYNRLTKLGKRQTFWKSGRVDITSNLQDSLAYMARSSSLVGDHLKPLPWYFRKTRSVSVTMLAVQTDKNSGYDHEVGCYGSSCDTDPESLPAWLSSQQQTAYNNAVGDLGDKLRGTLDLSINLFQWRQILSLADKIRYATKTYIKTVSRLKSGFGPASKEVSSYYLEYIYGIRPLLDDIYNTFEKLLVDAKSGGPLLHYRGRGKSVEGYLVTENVTAFGVVPCPATVKGERSARCQLDIYIKPELSSLQKISGYTSLNPISIGWELVPYSFVVDWFFNLGGYLRALETSLLYQRSFVYGCRTDTILHYRSFGGAGTSPQYPTIKYQVTGGNKEYKMYDRTVLTAYPSPERPTLKTSLSPWRIVNAVALLLQLQPDPRKPRTGKTSKLHPLG